MILRQLLENIKQGTTDIIVEGRGLAARVPGELFKNAVGDVITFQSLNFFPARGAFNSQEELQTAIATGTNGKNIHWTNKLNSGMFAFAIATFIDESNTEYYLGRYYKTISPNRVGNEWQHKDIPGGFTYQSKAGLKENSDYKPSKVLTKFQENNIDSITDQIIKKFGQSSDEVVALNAFIAAHSFPITFPKGNIDFAAFRDYFCEMLQPMALLMGKPIKGNANDAAEIFMGTSNYNDCTISFNAGATGGLYDSLLVSPEGKQIKLSSKGVSGANASVVNLLKSINELKATPKGAVLLIKHKAVLEILKDIDTKGHFGAPLKLAIDYNIIDSGDDDFAMTLKKYGPDDQIDWQGHKKLETLYNGRKARDMTVIIPIEHLISAIAYKVATHVNDNTDFGKAASDILNHSALVQMYTEASESSDTITIKNFNAVYPSATVTGVKLDATKTYMSTQGKGNFTFKILKNGAADNSSDEVASTPARSPKKVIVPKDKAAMTVTSTNRKLK